MRKNKIIYVFDAYCSWCYGMEPVMEQLADKYRDVLEFEVLSGGLIPKDTSVAELASRFTSPREAYHRVIEMTGQQISEAYIEMMEEPEVHDYTFNSEYPARAMVTLKHFAPGREVQQAAAIQDLVFSELRDLTKTESYKSVAEKFGISWDAFVHRLESDESLQEAKYEFHLARQLEVTSYPAVLMQTSDHHFYLIARGYTSFDSLDRRIIAILDEKASQNGNTILPQEE